MHAAMELVDYMYMYRCRDDPNSKCMYMYLCCMHVFNYD